MNIVFAARADLLIRRGGDTVQILKTKTAIEAISGKQIVLCLDPAELATFSGVDIVHVFNLQTTDVTLDFVRAAREIGAKVALSTIYWNLWHAAFVDKIRSRWPNADLRVVPYLENLWRFVFQGRASKKGFLGQEYMRGKKEIIDRSDLLLPNSDEELITVAKDVGVDVAELVAKTVVVPNAVDLASSQNVRDSSIDDISRTAVAIVGRIEPIKNQLGVIQALMNRPEVPMLIIGRKSSDPKHDEYCRQVYAAGKERGNVQFIDEIPHEEVMALLARVKVHVLASFRESPGLATLEALYAGCNVVTSSEAYCPTLYYSFDKHATQCDPFSIRSIREAIERQLSAPKPLISPEYFESFSYDSVAKCTYGAYVTLSHEFHIGRAVDGNNLIKA